MTRKITDEEREQLLSKRLDRINNDSKYRREIFKLYYKDDIRENNKAWSNMDEKAKLKIIKQINKFEDNAFTNAAFSLYKNPKKALAHLADLKHQQLVEWGVRDK